MTNFEKIQGMSLDELAAFLCEFVDIHTDDCDKCPATEFCRKKQNGFKVWLEQDAE